MCHHRESVDAYDLARERERDADETDDDPDEPEVAFELDREFDERETESPADD
jgi:hypothetical protein